MEKKQSFLSKANDWILKWPGLFGIPFYIFFANSAAIVRAADPAANLLDMAGHFYKSIGSAAVNNFIPGTGILLSEIFRITADVIAPGVGSALSGIFHAVSGGSALADTASLTADFSPGLR